MNTGKQFSAAVAGYLVLHDQVTTEGPSKPLTAKELTELVEHEHDVHVTEEDMQMAMVALCDSGSPLHLMRQGSEDSVKFLVVDK